MDVYDGPVRPDFSNQIADFNFGIDPYPSGLFWTRSVAPFVSHVDADAGTARWKALVSCGDHHDIINALVNGPATPAAARFRIEWAGGKPYEFTDQTQRCRLKGNEGTSTIEWRAFSRKFSFKSDPIDTSSSVFAAVVHEQNGQFF